MRIGILGGTFDPPHIAHLVGAEAAHQQLGLDSVLLMPAGAPWQKADREVTAAVHRWEMTRVATAGVDYLVADDREVEREGWTYTIDTLDTFDEGDELIMILGADAASGLGTWERSDEVLARAAIAVVPRPGTSLDGLDTSQGHWFALDTPELAISGTELRERARAGHSLRFLVPDPVNDYIVTNRLYG